jgi:hypothetical protein
VKCFQRQDKTPKRTHDEITQKMYSATGFRTHMENKIAGLFYFFLFHSRGTAKEEEEEEKNMETLIQGSGRTVTDRHTKTTGRVCVCCHGQSRERKLDETKIRGLFFFVF